MCQEIVSVNMPIPRYLSNSKICQKVPSSKLIFYMQYANNSMDLSIVFKKKPLAYMRIYRHVPKGMLVWLNMRADSVPLHRSKSRTYKLVDCIKDAKFNNRGKLLQSVVLHLRNKQLTKTNKARLSVVDLRKYKASIYLEKAKFRGLKVLNYILTTALTNVTTITQRRMYEVAVRPETQTWMGAIIMKDLVECLAVQQKQYTGQIVSWVLLNQVAREAHNLEMDYVVGKPILTMKQYNIIHTMLLRRNRIMLKNRVGQLALHALRLKTLLRVPTQFSKPNSMTFSMTFVALFPCMLK